MFFLHNISVYTKENRIRCGVRVCVYRRENTRDEHWEFERKSCVQTDLWVHISSSVQLFIFFDWFNLSQSQLASVYLEIPQFFRS